MTQNGVPATRDDMAAALREHTRAIPDLVWDVQALVIEGNRIAARLRDTGPRRRQAAVAVTSDEGAFVERDRDAAGRLANHTCRT